MDVQKIIQELRSERDRVNGIIAALEQLHGETDTVAVKRRGRKFMDKKGRKEVSERMKHYWAERRKKQAAEKRENEETIIAAKAEDVTIADSTSNTAAHRAAA